MSEIDDYVDELPHDRRDALRRIRAVVEATAPDAEPGRSYGMPAYRAAGRPLLGMSSHRDHLSVHPFSAEVVAAVVGRFPGLDASKGTIRFTAAQPLPDDVIRALVELRLREIGP